MEQVRRWTVVGVERQKARECLSSNVYRVNLQDKERLARSHCWGRVPELPVHLMRHRAVDR